MNILEYALDVNKTKEEILELCKRLDISASNDDDILSDDDITLLDNEIQQMEDYIVKEEDTSVDEVEDDYDYELDEKVEKLISDEKIDVDNHKKKEKVKTKVDMKESNNNFKSMRKEMYKHREKLQSNESKDENVIVYKANMTVSDLASELGVNPLDLIKKQLKESDAIASLPDSIKLPMINEVQAKIKEEEEKAKIKKQEAEELKEQMKALQEKLKMIEE